MKRKNQMLKIVGIILLILISATCQKEETTQPAEQAPEIPPASTLIMDFSDFASSDTTLLERQELSRQNWWWAAVNVGVWSTLLKIGLIVPTAAFLESFHHQPTPISANSWEWSYNFVAGGIQHQAKLQGTLTSSGTEWEMYISKQGFYTDFLWYRGNADLLLSQGSWTLNNNPNQPNPLLQIDWHRNIQDSTADIKYTNVVPGGPENGGYIFYGITTDTLYDAFYDIFNKGQNNHTNIQWNRQTKAGRVMDPNHFGDPDWHCWDSQLFDTNCP